MLVGKSIAHVFSMPTIERMLEDIDRFTAELDDGKTHHFEEGETFKERAQLDIMRTMLINTLAEKRA